jgi:hypothetical protein
MVTVCALAAAAASTQIPTRRQITDFRETIIHLLDVKKQQPGSGRGREKQYTPEPMRMKLTLTLKLRSGPVLGKKAGGKEKGGEPGSPPY